MKVYADNAATTKMSRKAIDAMLPCMETYFGNPSSLYSIGQDAAVILQNSRETMAKYLNADPKEIYFTSGGSEADNQAIVSAAMTGKKKGKNHIISTAFEHHAVLHTLKKLENQGFEITLLDVHENGIIDPKQVSDAIKDNTCLVTVMYANNEIGTVQPIEQIGRICREKGVIFHTDAVQAAGHIAIDVKKQNIDMLSLSAHKFHGPKGTGVLYAKSGIALVNIIEGGAQERGKRAGTENVPAIAGMAAAFSDACENIDENTKKVTALRDEVINGLSEIPHSCLNGDAKKRLPGNINFCFEGVEGESILLMLDENGISVSSGSACASGSLQPSHVLLAIGRPAEIAHGSLRITLDAVNTEQEAAYIIKTVPQVIEYLRNMSPVWRDLNSGKQQFILK